MNLPAVWCGPVGVVALVAAPPAGPPRWLGDSEAPDHLTEALAAALDATDAFGPWPGRPWTLHLHLEAATFEQATGAPPQRGASWVGDTLHLRPWSQLQRRDLGSLLRHELVHRRLAGQGLARWREEALCLWAEGHVRPPEPLPEAPDAALQAQLDKALAGGGTARQAWAYAWLRAWLRGGPLPEPPRSERPSDPWEVVRPDRTLTVVWPAARMPRRLVADGVPLDKGTHRWSRPVAFEGAPVTRLEGEVEARSVQGGWELRWTVPAETWVAAAAAGELGEDAPFEARRALASVLWAWLGAHPEGHHSDGSLCPLTHCAVVRGLPSASSRQAAATAPELPVPASRAYFTGSAGGASLSPRAVWGGGSSLAGSSLQVPGDRWAQWERTLEAREVQYLKKTVAPGLKPGQLGLMLGASGPYPVEELRLAAGRAFGWTRWPSNVCTATPLPGGGLRLEGRGWGHHVGLCLVTAVARAREGWRAEQILAEAFPQEGAAAN